MFQRLGTFVCRFWPGLLVAWTVTLLIVVSIAPDWRTVVQDGEFAFLPEDAPSRVGEIAFIRAFPEDMRASTIVIVVRRESSEDGLTTDDLDFVSDILVPRIIEIAEADGGLAWIEEDAESPDDTNVNSQSSVSTDGSDEKRSIIARVRDHANKSIGSLLLSEDKQATLVYVELTTEFLEYANGPTIQRIESLVAKDGELRSERLIPPGLAISISGSATVGRDMRRASDDSAKSTELWTVLMVMTLLIIIYRAPILATIPLVTVAFATEISLDVLALLGKAGVVSLFDGIEVYVTVLVYGAGVDYCLFLIARYKEELDNGATYDEAVSQSLEKVGAAITASAGTVICGIGMMIFAEFGKFREAGVAITLSLAICLGAALTLTPCLMRLTHRWAFWPYMKTEKLSQKVGWISASSMMARVMSRNWFEELWKHVGHTIRKRPGFVWTVSVLAMLPFAAIGVIFHSHLSYGLLAELPQDEASVIGAKAIQSHFPAGYVDPVKVLVRCDSVNFTRTPGINLIENLTLSLRNQGDELGIADVRSVSHPQGGEEGIRAFNPVERRTYQDRFIRHYVSEQEELRSGTTRLEIVFTEDPFARDSIQQLAVFRERFRDIFMEQYKKYYDEQYELYDLLKNDPEDPLTGNDLAAEFEPALFEILTEQETNDLPDNVVETHFIGATPSMFDLKQTTDRDQIRIDILVLFGVFLILVILLRRTAISAYLIVSVFFSYLATLGVTFFVFWAMNPGEFSGLDWKVPMFLFTILIAVGEDYNIFLMTRIEEEQNEHGPLEGITVALERTGSIISSCGLIMAGTFSSLLSGSLVGMHQLGFALAFGVLLDTFVVRPILVPAYLVMLQTGRFGRFSKYLGAHSSS